jgi:hypothetical protein
LDARKTHADHGAHAEIEREAFVQLVEVGVVRLQNLSLTVEAENEGRSFEGAEHDGDTPVLLQMSDCLGAAAREVLIGDRMGIKDG